MEWRCEWCGKPHAENDPPCDNCGHGSFEKAVVPAGPEGEGNPTVWACTECGRTHPRNNPPCSRCGNMQLEQREQRFEDGVPLDTGDPAASARVDEPAASAGNDEPGDEDATTTVWACTECGRAHPRNNPPCSRCGHMQLEQREQRFGDLDPDGGGWLDALDAKYALGFLAVFLVVGLVVTGAGGILPGTGVPAVEDVPGNDTAAAGLSLSETERAYVEQLNERRAVAGDGRLEWSGALAEQATYANQRVVQATYGDAGMPSEEELNRQLPDTDRCSGDVYYSHFETSDRSASAFDSEEALAAALLDAYRSRGGGTSLESGLHFVGVDVHVGPDGTVFATQFVC